MSSVSRVGDLEVAQDLAFQRREWTAQRVGWALMALLLVVALLGGFGRGPLADASAVAGEGALRLDDDRLERKRAPSELRLELGPNTAQGTQVEVWIDRDYLSRFEVQRISPEPERMDAGAARTVFVFTVEDPTAPARVTFQIEANRWGRSDGRLGLVDGPELHFTQFVYP